MKPSVYNFVWSTDDPEKVMIFNSLTTALAEVRKSRMSLLNASQFDYALLPENERQFVDELQKGGFLVDDTADELRMIKFAYNSDKYDGAMARLVIAPTLACNFACSYCFEQSDKSQSRKSEQNVFMPDNIKQDLLNYIEKIVKTGKDVFVTWYGGEPLLAKETVFDLSQKIIAITEEHKVRYSAGMVTNGYFLSEDPDTVQNLKKNRIKFIHVTLDGSREVHDSRRMLKGSNGPTFDRILEGIKLLKASDIETYIRVNVDRSNIDNMSRLLEVLKDNNLSDIFIYLGHVIPYTAGCKSYESSCILTEEFSIINQTFYKNLNLMGFEAGRESFYPRFARACDANRTNAFVLDPDGDIYKCWTEIGNKTASIGKIGDLTRQNEEKGNHEI
ncbi:arylsulfatase regulator [Methanosarcina horonobensis HB-1 = JCM 15518]|uniref:Arylsulfatase regulator n=1 Tax=Methanosarcina horonobensis HB-1 = JCM 15518 TaxID=1434110 RepID=A0A0E3SCB6_9EURY|nr:radical SAM protein [Methanosarcina horonobensis]AKB78491.1 arylsulfatase regulator [Methanosarcina horonobensis HB-1 = JCM 15518]